MFGRETQAHLDRVERTREWVHSRSPFAMLSVACGLLSVFDSVLMVLSIPAGIAAIALAIVGWRDLNRRDHLLGRRLCITGAALGALGITLASLMWTVIVPAIKQVM